MTAGAPSPAHTARRDATEQDSTGCGRGRKPTDVLEAQLVAACRKVVWSAAARSDLAAH